MWRRLLTIFGYLAAVAVIMLATFSLVAYGQGYTYDFQTGRIIRTGLVIIQSTPNGATVTLNGKRLKKKTTYRQSFEGGKYKFELNREGFHRWSKTLEVIASEVTLVQYVLLVPQKLVRTALDTRPAVTVQSLSNDHRQLAYVSTGNDAGVHVLTLNNDDKPVKVYTPRPATAEVPAEVITDVTWSSDASHLLVVAKVGEIMTHRVMTATGADLLNITEQYRFNFAGLRFSTGDWRRLYWVSPDGLRRLDLESQAVSAVLATNVRQFEVSDNRVLYIQSTELGKSLWALDDRGQKRELVAALPESESYAITMALDGGKINLTVVPSRTRVGTLYSDVIGATPVAKTLARDVDKALFSPDGRRVVFYGASTALTYDLERSELTGKTVSHVLDGVNGLTSLSWYDSFHLLRNQGGHLWLSEYDGVNAHDLGEMYGTYPAFSSADLRSVVSFRPDNAGTRLERILLRP